MKSSFLAHKVVYTAAQTSLLVFCHIHVLHFAAFLPVSVVFSSDIRPIAHLPSEFGDLRLGPRSVLSFPDSRHSLLLQMQS